MECLNPIKVAHVLKQKATKVKPEQAWETVWHKVPCGKCAFCLLKKRSEWMFRIFYEMKMQVQPGWFMTLTYNEKYVKRVPAGLSLRFRDVQLFLKKLRKAKYYAKYICVGEYGSETKRPHYHLLLWTDCKPESFGRYWTRRSDLSLGEIHVGRLTMASAMYTLKYIINPKQKEVDGLEKTRAQFSKGLGLAYLSSRVYAYHTADYECACFRGMVDGRVVALPRYYRYKIFTKYQMKIEGARIWLEKLKNETEQFKELRSKGVKNIRPYLKALRVERAKQILKSTKYGQTI